MMDTGSQFDARAPELDLAPARMREFRNLSKTRIASRACSSVASELAASRASNRWAKLRSAGEGISITLVGLFRFRLMPRSVTQCPQ